jgi:hypothetical protein
MIYDMGQRSTSIGDHDGRHFYREPAIILDVLAWLLLCFCRPRPVVFVAATWSSRGCCLHVAVAVVVVV